MNDDEYEEAYLRHYGTLRKSGRFPWGSGKDQTTRNKSFLDHVKVLKDKGLSDTEIVKGLGLKSTTELRALKSIAKNELKQADIARATRLKEAGNSNVEIGKRMGINESSVRSLLADGARERAEILTNISNQLRDEVAAKKYVDIGTGVENHLGISKDKLAVAVAVLKEEGYEVHTVQVNQLGTAAGNKTGIKVLAPPGTTYRDIVMDKDSIKQVGPGSDNQGRSFDSILPPIAVKPSRVGVRYAEDGGTDADGVIYVRPGVKDLSLGGSQYAQVRIQVGNGHFLKGMAVYKDDLPDGTDLLFNTNKSNTGNKLDAMKPLKDDPDSPFGSIVKQIGDRDVSGRLTKVTSAMNLVNEQGDWEKWSKSLSTQVLSKQRPTLAKKQFDETFDRRVKQFDEISKLTNPAVRKRLLEDFAEDVDAAAVHLKAAALPRQASHVILPVNTLKESEIYAPNYDNGTRVALIRYPHGGIFEIPELVVNNNHAPAKKLIGRATDAVGIHSEVAKRLSGADFDGDTVLVIPNDKGHLKTAPALEKLKGFDPQSRYPAYEGMPKMSARTKGIQMGLVSNLITDMTIRKASSDEIARAVRHSMVVIDAEKHNLNYRQSSIDHGIPALMQKYQGRSQGGASTLISKATARQEVPRRTPRAARDGGPVDRETGKKVFTPTDESYTVRTTSKKTGEVKEKTILRTERSTKLAETDDAYTLSSGTPIEAVYANHSNRLKAMANEARRVAVNTKAIPYNPSAKRVYSDQVKSLEAKLNVALMNRPLERQAQVIANTIVAAKRASNPDMEPAEVKKVEAAALREARIRTGAQKQKVRITDDEWEAIQAGAVSNHRLTDILKNADMDRVKELATPKPTLLMTTTKTARAQLMLANGATQAEVASALGVSLSTLKRSLNGG